MEEHDRYMIDVYLFYLFMLSVTCQGARHAPLSAAELDCLRRAAVELLPNNLRELPKLQRGAMGPKSATGLTPPFKLQPFGNKENI